MRTKATSFRLDRAVHRRLALQARKEGVTLRALLERLVVEGLESVQYPGIVYRGRPGQRRAGLAAGPDVWEVMDALRHTAGEPEERIAETARRLELHPRQVRLAVEFACSHRRAIEQSLAENDALAESARAAAKARNDLLAS